MVIKKKEHVKERSSKISKKLNIINNFFFISILRTFSFSLFLYYFVHQDWEKKEMIGKRKFSSMKSNQIKSIFKKI